MARIVWGLLVALAGAAPAADLVWVMPEQTYQTIAGWGQGSMDQRNVPWFAELAAAERERLLDRLYTLDGDGLGLSICRTYICAGDAPGHHHFDRRPGGSTAPLGYEPEDGTFQWDGHEASVWMAQGAKARGAMLVAFWNSPPWWLTVSGCTAGAAGGTSNLRPGLEDRFAVHICAILRHYRDAWGVEFDRVSPINEPEPDWWREGGGQDGCHVDAPQAARLVGALARRLTEYGLRTQIQAPEMAHSGSLGYLDELLGHGDASAALTELTCHQYSTDFHSLRRWPQRARQNGKPLWMSEWGNWTDHGIDLALSYAGKVSEAMRVMQAEAWCMWEPGFLLDQHDGRLSPNAAWYAVAQFTRFARPGMVVVEASDTTLKTTAYLDEAERRLVLVTTNDTVDAMEIGYDLSAFAGTSSVRAWRSSAEEKLVALPEQPTQDGFAATLPPRSVTTFVVGYQRLVPPLLTNGSFETGKLDGWTGEPAALTGVQDNYPHGGSYDGFIDLKPGATGRLSQRVTGLAPGRRYRLQAACATSGLVATLAVAGAGVDAKVAAQGGAYRHAAVEFAAPTDGQVTVSYSAGPSEDERPWATIDSVRLSALP